MVLEFFRQIPNCSGVHRRSSPGYRGSFSPPVSNDTDSRSSLSERTVKRVASRYLERARKSGDFSFLRCFFCIFVPVAGKNRINGHPVKVGDKMDPNRDVLHVDDERIYIQKNQQLYYLALYKPRGYVTTASDELGRKTVMELVSDIPARLYPVGRLDKDSEGLLLMTSQLGKLTSKPACISIISPSADAYSISLNDCISSILVFWKTG